MTCLNRVFIKMAFIRYLFQCGLTPFLKFFWQFLQCSYETTIFLTVTMVNYVIIMAKYISVYYLEFRTNGNNWKKQNITEALLIKELKPTLNKKVSRYLWHFSIEFNTSCSLKSFNQLKKMLLILISFYFVTIVTNDFKWF